MTTTQNAVTEPSVTGPQKRTGTRVWLLLLVAVAAVGVWYAFSHQKTPRIVLITSGDGPYWDPIIAGANEAAKQFNVDLVIDRIKSDPYVQAETIKRRLAEEHLDGVAISPLNASIQANLLADIGGKTTLVTLDSDAPVTGRLLFVGTNNYDAGRSAGQSVKDAIPDGGEVILCLGNADKENTQHRRQGVIDVLLDRGEEPNRSLDAIDKPVKGEKYTVVATLVDDSNPELAKQKVTEALQQHPGVKCFVGLLGYSAPAIVAALEQAGKAGQVKVVGFDVDNATVAAVEKGTVFATIMQDQYGCGYHAIRVLADRARGQSEGLPLFQMHQLSFRTIREANVAEARLDPSKRMTGAPTTLPLGDPMAPESTADTTESTGIIPATAPTP